MQQQTAAGLVFFSAGLPKHISVVMVGHVARGFDFENAKSDIQFSLTVLFLYVLRSRLLSTKYKSRKAISNR